MHLQVYLDSHQLTEPLQSAYKSFHSCETALVRVQKEILGAIDNRLCVMLLLLDLSATFDTLDYEILLKRLNSKFSICGTTLDWFRSYLTNRTSTGGSHSPVSSNVEYLKAPSLGPSIPTLHYSTCRHSTFP